MANPSTPACLSAARRKVGWWLYDRDFDLTHQNMSTVVEFELYRYISHIPDKIDDVISSPLRVASAQERLTIQCQFAS